MRHLYLLLTCFALPTFAQIDSLDFLGRWDDDTLAIAGAIQYNDVWGYVDCDSTEYALLGSREFVHTIQIQDDGTPVEVNRIPGGQNVTWRDMKTYENYAYAVCDGCSEGMLVMDLSTLPDSATLVLQTNEFFSRSHNIYIDTQHGRLYAVGTDSTVTGVIVLDLTGDPGNPTLLADVELPGGYVHDIHVVDHIAYASHGNAGLYIYDMTDAANPVTLGSITDYEQQGYNHSSWLDPVRGVLVWADETFNRAVKIADVSDPSDITVTDLFRSTLLAPADTGSIAHNPFIRDNYAIISYYHDGIQIFDISDPTNVVQVAGYDTQPDNVNYNGFRGAWGAYPYLASGRILGSDVTNGLFVLEWLDNPFNPIATTTFPPPESSDIFFFGDADLCAGDTTQLLVTADGFDVTWTNLLTGDTLTGEVINVTETGQFTVEVADKHCRIQGIDTVDVIVNEFPTGTLSVENEQTVLCPGDSTTLVINGAAQQYAWFESGALIDGAMDSTLTVFAAGSYGATLSNGNCLVTLDAQEIEAADPFFVMLMPPNFTFDTWELSVESSGAGVQFDLFGYATTNVGDTVLIASGVDSTFSIDGDTYFGFSVYVEVTDANGCTAITNEEALIFESVEDLSHDSAWQIAPNPVRELLNLSYSGNHPISGTYRILDPTGRPS